MGASNEKSSAHGSHKSNAGRQRHELLAPEDCKPNGCPKTIGPIGGGGQGCVFECAGNQAYKAGKNEPNRDRGRHLYKNLDHPNVIKYHDARVATPEKWGEDQVKCYSQKLDKTLYEKIQDGPFTEKEMGKLMSETLDAVNYLHQNQVIHMDLKSKNIMLDKYGNNIVIDLESSRRPWDLKEFYSTLAYIPPELYIGRIQNGEKFDAFCLGMTYAEAALGIKQFDWVQPRTYPEKIAQLKNIKEQLIKADIPETHRKQILELLEVDAKDRPSVAEAKYINNGSEEAQMIPVKAYREKAAGKADRKAKQQQTYTIIGGIAGVAGSLAKKTVTGEKIDVKQDVTKPFVSTGIRVGQIECERQLRRGLKSRDFTKNPKLGFKSKAGIAVAGAAISEAVNQIFFDKDRDTTSVQEKVKRIGLEMGCSFVEYSLNYGGAKLVKAIINRGVEKVATYGVGKGISTGTALLTKVGGSTVSKIISSGVFGLVSFGAGLAIDGVRILISKEEDRGEAFKQAAKTNLAATAGQTIGAALGSFLGPVGTVVGGIAGAAVGSFLASLF